MKCFLPRFFYSMRLKFINGVNQRWLNIIYVDFKSVIGQFLRLLIGRIFVLLNSDWLRSIREKVKLACLVVKETTASLTGIIGEGTLSPRWNPRTILKEYLLLIIIHTARYHWNNSNWNNSHGITGTGITAIYHWVLLETNNSWSVLSRSSSKQSPYSKDFLKIIQRNFNILGEILLMILAKMKGQIR